MAILQYTPDTLVYQRHGPAAQGIPTFCSSGDDGSIDRNPGDGIANVDYPASSPNAFGCGGTKITLNDIVTEIAWDASGGGISLRYKVPDWQARPCFLCSSFCALACFCRGLHAMTNHAESVCPPSLSSFGRDSGPEGCLGLPLVPPLAPACIDAGSGAKRENACSQSMQQLHVLRASAFAPTHCRSCKLCASFPPVMRVQALAVSNAGISNSGMRCVPDAAADADPASGYVVIMCGLFQPLVKHAFIIYCLQFTLADFLPYFLGSPV